MTRTSRFRVAPPPGSAIGRYMPLPRSRMRSATSLPLRVKRPFGHLASPCALRLRCPYETRNRATALEMMCVLYLQAQLVLIVARPPHMRPTLTPERRPLTDKRRIRKHRANYVAESAESVSHPAELPTEERERRPACGYRLQEWVLLFCSLLLETFQKLSRNSRIFCVFGCTV